MDKVILYSTKCPKCNVLERKLKEKNVEFEEVNSVKEMIGMGILQAPMLRAEGRLMDFSQAIEWVRDLGD